MKILYSLVLFSLFIGWAKGQDTEVYVLGTMHKSVYNYKTYSLVNILSQLNPDVILLEADSGYFCNDFSLENLSRLKKLKRFHEVKAVQQHAGKGNFFVFRPFDIKESYTYYYTQKGFKKKEKMYKEILSLYGRGVLSPAHTTMIRKFSLYSLESCSCNLDMTPRRINSPIFDALIDSMQDISHKGFYEILQKHKSLEGYINFFEQDVDFESHRHKEMIKNILQFSQEFPHKRILVLTGYMHRYYLIKRLKTFQQAYDFALKEVFPEG